LKPGSAFWDTSALVPLCVRESTSAQLKILYESCAPTIWWATPVEISSALARLLKTMQIDVQEWRSARNVIPRLANLWFVIQPSDNLRLEASELVEAYDLRAGDAFQLSAALQWCEQKPAGRMFISTDERLRDAALICGFDLPSL